MKSPEVYKSATREALEDGRRVKESHAFFQNSIRVTQSVVKTDGGGAEVAKDGMK